MTITKNSLLKRSLAVLLAFVMCLGIMPMSVFASSASEPTMREQVEAKLAEVEALNESDYTSESWNNLMTVYTTVKTNLPNLTDEQLAQYGSTYLSLLDQRIAALEEAETEPTIREQIEAKLSEVEALNEEDYTAESWNNLMTVYTTVKTNLPNLTDEQLAQYGSTYLSLLDQRIAALEEAEADSGEDDKDDGENDSVEITDEYLTKILNNEISIDGEICYDLESNNIIHSNAFKFFSAYAKNDENGLKITYKLDVNALTGDKLFENYKNARNIYFAIGTNKKQIELNNGEFTIEYKTLDELKSGTTFHICITYDARKIDGTLVETNVSWSSKLTPDFANKPITLTDSKTGITLLTSTKYYSKDAELTIQEITQATNGNTQSDPWANMMMHLGDSIKTANMYVVSLKDGNKTITEFKGWSASLLIPLADEMNENKVKFFQNVKSGNTFNYSYLDKYFTVTDDNKVFYTDDTVSGNYAVYEPISLDNTGENLADGTYTVNILVWKMIEDVASMANKGVVSPATLVVKNGVKTIYFDMQAVSNNELSSYMTHMWIYDKDVTYSEAGYPQGNIYPAIVNEYYKDTDGCFMTDDFNVGTLNYYPKSVYFELPNDAAEFPVRFRVPVMDLLGGGDFAQDARFRIDYSSAVKTSDETSDVPIKDALSETIKIADTVNKEDYTYASWSALKTAYDNAKELQSSTTATTSELTSAYTALRTAIDGLVSSTVDTSKLEALITTAETYKAEDYTSDSFSVLTMAIENAKATLNNGASTQVEIDAAKTALQTAIDGLKTKDSETLDINNLPDGKYTLTADMFKTDRVTASMSNGAINHNVWLEVIDGEYYLTIQFKGLAIYNQFGYLKDLYYFAAGYTFNQYGVPQGDLIAAEILGVQKDADGNMIVDQYNDANSPYPEMLRIKLVDKASAEYVPLQVFVPIMESIADETGTQPVMMKLDWTKIAKDDGTIEPEKPVEQSPAINVTDKETGVKVEADKGVFPEGVELVVTEITKGDNYDKAASVLSDIGKKFQLFEIHFEDADGNEIQPNGLVTVSYKIPSGFDSDKLVMYRINDDGTKTLIKGEVKDGYYVVLQKSISTYALIEKGSTDTDGDNTDNNGSGGTDTDNGTQNGNNGTTDSPQTGDNSHTALWFGMLIASAFGLAVMFFTKKRRINVGE